jgi:hypothetical protein
MYLASFQWLFHRPLAHYLLNTLSVNGVVSGSPARRAKVTGAP